MLDAWVSQRLSVIIDYYIAYPGHISFPARLFMALTASPKRDAPPWRRLIASAMDAANSLPSSCKSLLVKMLAVGTQATMPQPG